VSVAQWRRTPPEHAPGASAHPGPGEEAAGQAAVRLSEVSKVYGRGPSAVLALDRVSLTVAPGEFTCLIGASGCGKSTLLSLVAGLDQPTAGSISTQGRRVTLMFQEPALFPWLTAARNVELALRARGVPVTCCTRSWSGSGASRGSRSCSSPTTCARPRASATAWSC